MESFSFRLLNGSAKSLPPILTARLMQATIFERAIFVLNDAHFAATMVRIEIALLQNPACTALVIIAGADGDSRPIQEFLDFHGSYEGGLYRVLSSYAGG